MKDLGRSEPYERLAWARAQAGFETAADAARAFGWNENTYRSHENGERGLRRKVAEVYAKALKVDLAFLLIGSSNANPGHVLPIVGTISDGAEVNFVGEFDTIEHKYRADIGVIVRDNMIAIEVDERSNLSCFQPHDLLIFFRNPFQRTILDHISLIATMDDKYYVRIMRPSNQGGLFHLELPSCRTMFVVTVDTVKLLHLVIPGSQWSKIDTLTNTVVERKWRKA